jgi:hypothetical protein
MFYDTANGFIGVGTVTPFARTTTFAGTASQAIAIGANSNEYFWVGSEAPAQFRKRLSMILHADPAGVSTASALGLHLNGEQRFTVNPALNTGEGVNSSAFTAKVNVGAGGGGAPRLFRFERNDGAVWDLNINNGGAIVWIQNEKQDGTAGIGAAWSILNTGQTQSANMRFSPIVLRRSLSARSYTQYNGVAPQTNHSQNVTSVARNGTGDYSFTLSEDIFDAFPCTVTGVRITSATLNALGQDLYANQTTTVVRLLNVNSAGTLTNSNIVNMAVFDG